MTRWGLRFVRQRTCSICRWYCASHGSWDTASRTRQKICLSSTLLRFDLVTKQGRLGREMWFGRSGAGPQPYWFSNLQRSISSTAERRNSGGDMGDEESLDFKSVQWRKTIQSIAATESENDDMEARLLRLHSSTEEGVGDEPGESGWTIDNSSRSGTFFGQNRGYHGEEQFEETEGNEGEEYDDEDDYDDDSDSDANEGSDEEFEFEETDDELEELLANASVMQNSPEDAYRDDGLEYRFRPDHAMSFESEYEPEVLDVSQPVEESSNPMPKLTFSVKKVIELADFRNVRFLTNFIGESGNILARRQFDMRAKSHGKIIKAIKTARAFGLMPYTNMGSPRFFFNRKVDLGEGFFSSDEEEGGDNSDIAHAEQIKYGGNIGSRAMKKEGDHLSNHIGVDKQ